MYIIRNKLAFDFEVIRVLEEYFYKSNGMSRGVCSSEVSVVPTTKSLTCEIIYPSPENIFLFFFDFLDFFYDLLRQDIDRRCLNNFSKTDKPQFLQQSRSGPSLPSSSVLTLLSLKPKVRSFPSLPYLGTIQPTKAGIKFSSIK